jgi:uncharacterized membrane protein YphA (DoxX/SURF4 family)
VTRYVVDAAILTPHQMNKIAQRWYTTFPHGLPGIGLLLLRTAVGVRLFAQSYACMLDAHGMRIGAWALGWLALGSGILLVLGLLSPLAACVSTLAETVVYFCHPVWAASFLNLLTIDTLVVAVAIALLGPGWISLDAYFFGRRKIVIPRVARS